MGFAPTAPSLLGLDRLTHDGPRTSLHLFINWRQIFANNTEADHQKAANDEFQKNYGGETSESVSQFQIERLDAQSKRKDKKYDSCKRHKV